LGLCEQLKISTIVVVADIVSPLEQTDIDRSLVSLQQAAEAAEKRGIKVALEFQSRAPFINNLQTASAIADDINSPSLGICLDAFHFFTGPSKMQDLERMSVERLFHVQLSDVADVPREFATDSQRILPGEGGFGVPDLLESLRRRGYEGTVSLELMNPRIWQVPAVQFGEIGITALRMLLGSK
jgi:sugar phosphate isomerase/epimerase